MSKLAPTAGSLVLVAIAAFYLFAGLDEWLVANNINLQLNDCYNVSGDVQCCGRLGSASDALCSQNDEAASVPGAVATGGLPPELGGERESTETITGDLNGEWSLRIEGALTASCEATTSQSDSDFTMALSCDNPAIGSASFSGAVAATGRFSAAGIVSGFSVQASGAVTEDGTVLVGTWSSSSGVSGTMIGTRIGSDEPVIGEPAGYEYRYADALEVACQRGGGWQLPGYCSCLVDGVGALREQRRVQRGSRPQGVPRLHRSVTERANNI